MPIAVRFSVNAQQSLVDSRTISTWNLDGHNHILSWTARYCEIAHSERKGRLRYSNTPVEIRI